MKEAFEAPKVEIIVLDENDIIASSGCDNESEMLPG